VADTNPFEDEDGTYLALINDEGQYSLWPVFAEVPEGWTVAHKEDTRKACLDFIEENWTDMRPNTLIEQMRQDEERAKKNGNGTKRAATAESGS
jgi:MbtH protein